MAPGSVEKVLAALFWAFIGLFFAVFRVLSCRKAGAPVKKLPPVSNPLLLMSATQLAKKIRLREVCMRPGQERSGGMGLEREFLLGKKMYKKPVIHKQEAFIMWKLN